MSQPDINQRFRTVGDGSKLSPSSRLYQEELQLATRNRGMPLEGLGYSITPTGMHYLLVHYDIPMIDPTSWLLKVEGHVAKSLSLTVDDIKERPRVTHTVTMECAGNGRALLSPRPISQPWLVEAIGTAEWTGTPLRGVLEDAGLTDKAVEVLFTGRDRGVEGNVIQNYQRSLSIEEATRDEVLLAYEMNGQPMQPQHGFPLRLLVPGWYGMTSVKWLDRIDAIDEAFDGYQMNAYRYAQSEADPGERASLIKVRALMVPPGIPDFLTRTRLLEPGPVVLAGRAWAGRAEVSRVEVSVDGGSTWSNTEMGGQISAFAWRSLTVMWNAKPGRYTLCVRGTDAEGNVQPVEQPWNAKGMGNNMAQRIEVVVEEALSATDR